MNHAPLLGPWERPVPSRHVVARAGVFEQLDLSSADPLTILRAPAGAGKTTSVLQWLQLRQLPDVTWVNARQIPGSGREQRAAMLWEQLWARPVASGSGRRRIVIDDFARGVGGELDELILESARNPRGPRWILLTRVLGGIEHQLGVHNIDATVLTARQLHFSHAEAAAFLSGALPAAGVAELWELTGGAPWLLRTAREAALRNPAPARTLYQRTREAVLGDVMVRIRGSVAGPDDLALLSRLGLLPGFTPEAARRLEGGSDSAALLSALEAAGISTRVGSGCREEYEFSTVIRTVLRARHDALPQPERHRDDLLVAGYAMANNDPATALEIAVGGGHYELASQVLLRHADSFLNGGLGGVAEHLLPIIPHAAMARYPVLAVALGLTYNIAGIHPLRSRELLGMAAAVPGSPGPGAKAATATASAADPARNAGERFVMDAVRAIALRVAGIGDRGRSGAVHALDAYAALEPDERDGIGGAEELLLTQVGISLHLAGADEQAHTAAARAVDAAHHGVHRQETGYSSTLLAYLHAVEGDMRAASRVLAGVDPGLWEDPETPAYLTSPYRLARAVIALEETDWDTARNYLELMRDQLATSEFWPVMRYCAGILEIACGRAPAHLARLEVTLGHDTGLPPIGVVGEVFTGVTLAWLHLAKGDLNRALEPLMAPKAQDLIARDTTVLLLRARIELARNRPVQALELIGGCRLKTVRERHNAAALGLAAELALGREEHAGEALEVVLGLSDGCGLWLGLLLLPEPDLLRVQRFMVGAGVSAPLVMGYSSPIPGNLATVWLTGREHAILTELRSTGNTAQIAQRQFVSVNTVKSQLRSIYRKLGVSGRADALHEAEHLGLI